MKSVHCIHYVVCQNLVTEQINNSNHKCPMFSDRRVRIPYLIRTLALAFLQKIREFLSSCPYIPTIPSPNILDSAFRAQCVTS